MPAAIEEPRVDHGRIEYTGRALLQDAQEAMGGNIIRGLVELITNADDAYTRMDNGRGGILVEVEHRRGRPWSVVVRDRATGLSHQELKNRITRLGERSSGFERGLEVRGNRGRGAKDLVAFGPVVFETIKDDRYSYLRLNQDGSYEISRRDHTATREERRQLGVRRGNGTVVTVTATPSHRCPLHDNLAEQLQNHFQLRDIMRDDDREVVLANLTRRGEQRRLRCGLDTASLDQVLEVGLPIDDYPDATAHLKLWRLPERCEAPRSDPSRPCGVIVTGRRAIYDNSLFRFEGNPHAGWFTGRLDCPYIDELANEYDDLLERGEEPSAQNPIPIITRRRDGLTPEHPFARKLAKAVEDVLAEQVQLEEERERRESSGIANEETRRNLDRMAREAARFLQEALREIESEEPPVGGEGEVEPLAIVPPEIVIRLGEERTLSVLAKADGLASDDEVEVGSDPEGVIEILDGGAISLSPHRRRSDVLSGQIHVRPLIEGPTLVSASVNGRSALGLVTVKPQVDDDEPEAPPEGLEFERPRYQVRWNKRKALTIRAPLELVKEQGDVLEVNSSAAGVAVIGGGRVQLTADRSTGVATAQVRVDGRTLNTKATVRATLGDEAAECRVSVEQRDEGLPDLKIELVSEKPSVYRAVFDPPEVEQGERQTLKVYALHKSLKRYLGAAPDYPGQDTPEWRAVIAEVVTEAIVRRIVSRKYPPGREMVDADTVYYDHFAYASRLLPVMQRRPVG